jgi:phosphate transport system substrate-binding protein
VLTGAGSTAAAPVYKAWAQAYGRGKDFTLNYEAIGSSAGLRKIQSNEVAFAASDVAPSEAELLKSHLVVVPTFVSGVVCVVNLPRTAARLQLDGEILAAIFMGTVTRWNAPEVQALNPGVALPDLPMRPVVRSDGSGTTHYFTDYLSKVSPLWRTRHGVKSTVAWPDGFVGAKGSDALARKVKETEGAIGYIDFNYVSTHDLVPVSMRNALGEFVQPSVSAFRAALRASDWSSKGDFHASLADLRGRQVWPITMGTFVLFPQIASRPQETKEALQFFIWAWLKGDQVVDNMSFVRLPDKMQAQAFRSLLSITDAQGRSLGMPLIATLTQP